MRLRKGNRLIAWGLLAVLLITGTVVTPMETVKTYAAELSGLGDASRKAATEGIVLLENKDQTLPLQAGQKISVFGRVQVDTFYCGYGSGGYVYPSQKVSILEGLRQNPDISVNEDLAEVYEAWCEKNPAKGNDAGWAKWPYYHPEMPLEDEMVEEAAKNSDKAVVVIGRGAGEDRECKLEPGSYYLTEDEKDMLAKVDENFQQVIVLLNIGNIIDMSWMEDYEHITSILNIWQGGMQTGKAVADILSGRVNPSGKLASTIAKSYEDYPSSENFGNSAYNNYAEDIFVGYRYFETFEDAKEKVLYPFGYGLSYTSFDIQTQKVSHDDSQIQVDVEVTNTGDYAGKEVVQVYYGAPQGVLGKAAKSLAAYAKTPLLQPGESQKMTLQFDISSMASYDDSGKTGHKSAFVLEAGDYSIYVGNSVRNATEQGAYIQEELEVTQQLEEAIAPEHSFDVMTASEDEDGNIVRGSQPVATRTVDLKQRMEEHLPQEITYTGNMGYQLLDVYQEKITMDQFVAQMSQEELARIARGAGGMQSSLGTGGNAGVFGGVETSLRDLGIVPVSAHDGPSGLRLRDSDSSSLLPIGSLLACTWNNDLVEYLYSLLGQEMILNQVDILLAPGMNIQRDPLCGRNFEYFSEDPLVTGMMGAATTRGVQSSGAGACMKHFAANNQETNRKKTDSRVSERALREIYLKAFEIAVKTSDPFALMSGYNKLNGVWCCYNYELMTTILREQWGYDGVVMTDWSMQSDQSPFYENVKDNAYRVQAQVDLYMPGDFSVDSIKNALGKGLTLAELQRSAKNILNCVIKTPKFARDNALSYYSYEKPETYFQVSGGDQVDGESARLSEIRIDGNRLVTFHPLVQDYEVFHRPSDPMPEVTVTAPEGVQVTITQATDERPVATIDVEENGVWNTYQVFFEFGLDMTPTVENPIYAYLDQIYLNGEALTGFYSSLYDYEVIVNDRPEITVQEKEGVEATVTYLEDGSGAVILAQSPYHAVEYHITFGQGPRSDEFDGDTLSDFWTNHAPNEKGYLADGAWNIETEDGDLYQTTKDLKNYISQPAQGNWESVVKIRLSEMPSKIYHQIGIKIMEDEDNYLYFRLEQLDKDAGIAIRLNEEKAAKSTEIVKDTTFAPKMKDNTFYLKVRKTNQSYDFYVSADGETYFTVKEGYTANYKQPKYTLAASNGTGKTDIPSIRASYEYVHFTMQEEEPPKVISIGKEGQSQLKVAEDFFRKSDALTPEECSDEDGGLSMGYSDSGEWALYTINVEESGYYHVNPRISSAKDELYQLSFGLELDGQPLTTFMQLGGTGGWDEWVTMDAQTIYLEKGEHKLRLYYLSDGININWLQFDYLEPHRVSVVKPDCVELVLDQEEAIQGDTVSFTMTIQDEKKELESILAVTQSSTVTLKQRADHSYYFEMPDEDVTIRVSVQDKAPTAEEYQQLLEELQKKEAELAEKEELLAKKEALLGEKEQELSGLKDQVAQLKDELAQERDNVTQLTTQLTSAKREIERLESEADENQQQLQELQDQVERLTEQLGTAKEKVQELEETLLQAKDEIRQLETEKQQLTLEVSEAKAQAKQAQAQLEQIKAEAEEAKAQSEQAKEEAEKSKEEAKQAQEELKQAQEAAAKAKKEAQMAKEETLKAREELEKMKASMVLRKGDVVRKGHVKYRVTNAKKRQVEAYAADNNQVRSLKIADTVQIKGVTCKVVSIADRAFEKMKKLSKVTIGKHVTSIGKKAFYQDKKLKNIKIKSRKLKVVGKQSLKGISAKAVIRVPMGKREAYEKRLNRGEMKKTVRVK